MFLTAIFRNIFYVYNSTGFEVDFELTSEQPTISRVGNSHLSAGLRPTTLEEDHDLFVDFSSILCLRFEIQSMRTYNFFDWISNTDHQCCHFELNEPLFSQLCGIWSGCFIQNELWSIGRMWVSGFPPTDVSGGHCWPHVIGYPHLVPMQPEQPYTSPSLDPIRHPTRLIHSPNLVVVWLSVGEAWLPIGITTFAIG